jgi:hypothetical protein
LPSKLHYRALEHLEIASLEKNNNDYDRSVVFTAEARSDLHWWVVNATNENGVFLQKLQDIVVSIERLHMTSQPPCWCFNSK